MSSKVKVIVTGIPLDYFKLERYNKTHLEIALALQKEIGDTAVVLTETKLIEVLSNPTIYSQKILIEPGLMSHRRRTAAKLNGLFAYLLSMSRKLNISFIILVGDFDWLDCRIKTLCDAVERFSYDDYERLGVELC